MPNKSMTMFCLTITSILATSCGAVTSPDAASIPVSRSVPAGVPGSAGVTTPVVGYPQYPALSPDGRAVVFAWGGDLWAARLPRLPQKSEEGKAAGPDPLVTVGSRLTAHPAQERRSAFSLDGSLLAFESDRDGARNLYVMPITFLPGVIENKPSGGGAVGAPAAEAPLLGGEPRRITFSDAAQTLGSFAPDGKALLYSAAQDPAVYRQARMYRAPLDGSPVTRLTEAFGFLPRASADGTGILFGRGYSSIWERPQYRGTGAMELFRLSMADGVFTQITENDANDGDAYQARDGSIVFISSRDGQNNLWRLKAGATDGQAAAQQLTAFRPGPGETTLSHGVQDLAVSADGSTAAFVVWDTLYLLDLTKERAVPVPVVVEISADSDQPSVQRMNLDRQASEAALSPDGKTMAIIARGEVFVRATEEGRPTRRVTATAGRERDLAWSPDGKVLYFSSDESGTQAIYEATVKVTREELESRPAGKTSPAGGQPEGSAPGVTPAAGGAAAAKPEGSPPPEKPAGEATEKKKEPKPDHGKRWAESILFEVGPVVQVAGEDVRRPLPSPDGKKLLYVRGRGEMVVLDLGSKAEKSLLKGWDDPEVIWAGDSRHVIYAVSDLDYNSDIWLMDVDAEAPAERAVNLTRHPDTDGSPRLSADGKVLTYLSERAGENGEFDVWQVYLDKKLEGLKSYELDEYFKKAAEAAGKRRPLDAPSAADAKGKGADPKPAEAKTEQGGGPPADGGGKPADKAEGAGESKPKAAEPMEFDGEDAYLRVRRLTSFAGSEDELQMTPGGDRVLVVATIDGERSLISLDRKGEDRKVIQAGPGPGSNVSVSLTGDKVVFVKGGVASTAPAKGGAKVESLAIDAPVTIDLARQQRQKFLEAARILGTRFYHNSLKGLDWNALTERYLSLAVKTSTPEEFNRVVGALFGELNGSHTGISGGGPPTAAAGGLQRPNVGVLGVETEPVKNGYLVRSVLEGSPADQRSSKLDIGDVIVGVDGTLMLDWGSNAGGRGVVPPVMPSLSQVLLGKAGKETLLDVERVDREKPRLVLIVPATAGAMNELGYLAEMKRRRLMVDRLSGGRLGYLHIRSMNDASVHDFERDLFAAGDKKAGLIIDVRDNGGGYTTDILLASLTAPVHAKTQPRGVDPATIPSDAYPRDRRLIYAYTRPINVLINENSFSNAEVFAHAIKTIRRGTLVGTRTFGAVISTGATTLIDGTTVRVPNRGWWLPDGKEMENNGAIPDVEARQRPEDDAAGRDAQIEAAVKELMGRVGK